ncbi:MAG: DNA methyltransferase [Candidatus Dadabacteria bacterium]|nr:DNA methyltransferase [Candidatus Dadabacteria bacterium]
MEFFRGGGQFRNEIVWKRQSAHSSAQRYGPVHDVLLYYSRSDSYIWNREYQAYDQSHIESAYRRTDADGRKYSVGDLTGLGLRTGESGLVWRGVDPSSKGRHWAIPRKFADSMNMPKGVLDGLNYLDDIGRIFWSSQGNPGFKRYLDEMPGVALQDVIIDIPPALSKERTGYPTQKPLALLDRIIKASSNENDIVLDPFCGCATALVAADRLNRKWIGIDLSELAIKLVNDRITEDRGRLWGGVNALTEPPVRTDLGKLPNYRTHRHRLYGEQEGICTGCDMYFPFRVMEVDHILPRAKGGTDHPDNLQLLCSGCNRSKGNKTMAEWRAAQS